MPRIKKPPDQRDVILEDMRWLLRDFKRAERQDVSLRLAENREIEFSVVKTTWNSFCHDAGRALATTVESAMKEIDKTICEAYILANLHVSRLCERGHAMPKLDQSFFYACLSAVSQAHKKKAIIKYVELRESVSIYQSWRPESVAKPDSTHLAAGFHQNASQQMATNASNMIELAFYNRFKRYLRHKYHLDGAQAYQRLQIILSKEAYNGEDAVITTYKPLVAHIDLKRRPESALPLLYTFSQYAEQENKKLEAKVTDKTFDSRAKLVRIFSLLPHKNGFGASHIKICQSGLYGLLKRSGQAIRKKDYDVHGDAWWRSLFDVSRFETSNRKFAGEILTDAVGVSIVLKKPRTKKRMKTEKKKSGEDYYPTDFDIEAYDQLWGLDPGRKDLFVASDEEDTVKKCSTKEFYHCAKYKLSVKKNKRWTDRDPMVKAAILTLPTKKTAELSTLETYVRDMLPKLDLLIEFYSRRRVRALKFKRFRFCQKKLNLICASLTEKAGRKTVVGFGDWSNQDGGTIKKCQSGPVKRLEKELKRRCRVVSIDEFRTSKLCHGCHRELTNAKRKVIGRDFRLHHTKVHSVLHCRNSDCPSMTVNRDVNASANMRDLLIGVAHGAKRFWAFSRANKNLEDTCSKVSLRLSSGTDVTTVGKDCTSCFSTLQS